MKKPVILCVDDEKFVLDSLRKELNLSFGNEFIVELAESATEALDLLDELIKDNYTVPVVISDWLIPGMKGDEFLIQVHNVLPDTRKIMLTGQATTEGVGNSVNKAKLYRYIAKPWEKEDLELTVKEAIKSYNDEKIIENQTLELHVINKNLDKLVKMRTQELENAVDELLKVKIGKKAYTTLFIVALAMFIAVDAFIEPVLQNIVHDFYIVLGIKGIIALLIKPVESLIEKYLYSKKRKNVLESSG